MGRYSAFAIAKEAFREHTGWRRAWQNPEPKKRYDAIIIGAGVVLAKSGDRISDVTGLGGLLIGMVLVAAATSLPEIAVAVSAVVTEDSPDLAIGNLFGSNMANMALLAIVALVWRGRVWQAVGAGHARTAAVAMTTWEARTVSGCSEDALDLIVFVWFCQIACQQAIWILIGDDSSLF